MILCVLQVEVLLCLCLGSESKARVVLLGKEKLFRDRYAHRWLIQCEIF